MGICRPLSIQGWAEVYEERIGGNSVTKVSGNVRRGQVELCFEVASSLLARRAEVPGVEVEGGVRNQAWRSDSPNS